MTGGIPVSDLGGRGGGGGGGVRGTTRRASHDTPAPSPPSAAQHGVDHHRHEGPAVCYRDPVDGAPIRFTAVAGGGCRYKVGGAWRPVFTVARLRRDAGGLFLFLPELNRGVGVTARAAAELAQVFDDAGVRHNAGVVCRDDPETAARKACAAQARGRAGGRRSGGGIGHDAEESRRLLEESEESYRVLCARQRLLVGGRAGGGAGTSAASSATAVATPAPVLLRQVEGGTPPSPSSSPPLAAVVAERVVQSAHQVDVPRSRAVVGGEAARSVASVETSGDSAELPLPTAGGLASKRSSTQLSSCSAVIDAAMGRRSDKRASVREEPAPVAPATPSVSGSQRSGGGGGGGWRASSGRLGADGFDSVGMDPPRQEVRSSLSVAAGRTLDRPLSPAPPQLEGKRLLVMPVEADEGGMAYRGRGGGGGMRGGGGGGGVPGECRRISPRRRSKAATALVLEDEEPPPQRPLPPPGGNHARPVPTSLRGSGLVAFL